MKAQDVENVENFKTSLQLIFGMLKCGKDKERLYDFMEAHEDELTHLDDVEAEALLALLGQMQIVEERLNSKKAKEAINVCKAIRDMIADGEIRGEIRGEMRGEKKGIDLGMLLISRLLEAGRIDDVKRVAVDTEFRDLLFAEFGLS